MVSLGDVKTGVCRFVDAEIMSKVNGVGKWFIGAMIVSLPKLVEDKYNEFSDVLSSMGVVAGDSIDIDKAEDLLIQSASKYGKADMSLAGVKVSLGCDDIRKVADYIRM